MYILSLRPKLGPLRVDCVLLPPLSDPIYRSLFREAIVVDSSVRLVPCAVLFVFVFGSARPVNALLCRE